MVSAIKGKSMNAENYFKVSKTPFFFSEKQPGTLQNAFQSAMALKEAIAKNSSYKHVPKISVFKMTIQHGPWDECETIL